MTDANLKTLKKQFVAISQMLEDVSGVENSRMLIDACCALVSVASSSIKASTPTEDEVEDIIISITALGDEIKNLCDFTKEDIKAVSGLDAIEDLKKAKEEADRLAKECSDASENLSKIEKQNEQKKLVAEDLKSKYEAQETLRDGYKNMIDDCSDEKRKLIEDEIKKLADEYSRLDKLYRGKKEERDNEKTKVEKIKTNITDIESEIKKLPDENKKLVEEYDAAKEKLERVKKASELYNEEKKNELDKEYAIKQKQVNEVREAIEDLKNTNITLDKEKSELTTDFFEKVDGVMANLQGALNEYRDDLDIVIKDADAMNESLTKCIEARNDYKHWFESEQTVVERMAKAAGTDFPKLKESMDLSKSEKIEPLFETIKESLDGVDEVLKKCIEAAGRDQKELERLAVNFRR